MTKQREPGSAWTVCWTVDSQWVPFDSDYVRWKVDTTAACRRACRNLAMWLRVQAGHPCPQIAWDYGLSTTRIHQIVAQVQRRQWNQQRRVLGTPLAVKLMEKWGGKPRDLPRRSPI